jgi:hypothetical protein
LGGGSLVGQNGATVSNRAGAAFFALGDTTFDALASGATFTNAGTFRKSGGSGTTTFRTRFNNSGTVEVQTGTMSLTGGGVSTGAFLVPAGATLNFGGGIQTLTATSAVSGGGTVSFTGPQFALTTVAGTYNVTGTTLVSGNGTADFARNGTTSGLVLSGGTLTGVADVTVTGLLTWTVGTMSGPGRTLANGGIRISSGDSKSLESRNLANAGTAVVTDGFRAVSGAAFNNLPGATFDVQANVTIAGSMFGLPAAFNNAGTFLRSTGPGTATVGVPFNNSGTVQVQVGRLDLAGSAGVSSGTFTVAAGTTLGLGVQTLMATSRVTGAGNVESLPGLVNVYGTYDVSGATLLTSGGINFAHDITFPSLVVGNGSLLGDADVTVTGLLTWSGGTMAGRGRTVVTGALAIGGGSVVNRTIDNRGHATWTGSGGLRASDGAVFNNLPGAVFDAQGTGSFGVFGSGAPTAFNNAGTFLRSAGTGAALIGVPFYNSGTVEVQAGGLSLTDGSTSSGTFTVAAGATLTFNSSTHTLQAGSRVTGAGTVIFSGSFSSGGTTHVLGT